MERLNIEKAFQNCEMNEKMSSLKDAFCSGRSIPYDAQLKLKVVARGNIIHYQSNGQEKQSLTVAVADQASCAKCIIYDVTKFSRRTASVGCKSPVSLKDIYIKDNTKDKVKVTLWRPSDVGVKPGDYVCITDVVVNTYKNEVSLSSTASTSVKVADAPLETSSLTIVEASVEDGETEVLLDDGDSRILPSELLQNALPAGTTIEAFVVAHAPLTIGHCEGSGNTTNRQ
ncbi:hypothetical protein MAR_014442 [Mya arenaria]|uniref:Shieldin complex subunit 2 first OB fold domain-containing protein n=1 Tax=Mya arenaria TaxID=6604 RepID=A0ABY7G2Q7_MYAAR|nr:hypothetical protein MAR_014442 [Mya arenaria]